MSIEGVVTGQIAAQQTWAASARQAAEAALSSLAAVEAPTYLIGQIPFTEPIQVTPVPADQPGDITVDTAPDIVEIADPTTQIPELVLDEVTLGQILDIQIPSAPDLNFPAVDFEAPVYTITKPKEWSFNVGEVIISDDPLVQACITRLKDNIENGGTGLSETVEGHIWNRDLERNEQTLSDTTDKVMQMWAKKGFSLPDGHLAHSLSEVQKEYENRRIDRSREIAIKQAELEQTNIFKSLEIAVELTTKIIALEIQYEELLLRSQEDIAKFANEYIDLQIKTYMALVDCYKAKVVVYEAGVRAVLAHVEVFKAQVDAQRLIGEVNKNTVEVFVEQIRANIAKIEQQKAILEAIKTEIDIQRTKIEANKLQMDAWAKKADVLVAKYNGQVELFKAVSQQNVSAAELQGRLSETSVRAHLQATELSVKAMEVNGRALQEVAKVKLEAAKGVAAAAASLAAGAMAGVTASAGLSYQEERTGELDD